MGNNCGIRRKVVEEICVEPVMKRSETIASNGKTKETMRENRTEGRIRRVEKLQQLAQEDAKVEVNEQKPSNLKTKFRRSMIMPFPSTDPKESLEKFVKDNDEFILGKLMVAVINFRGLIGISGITFDSYIPLITQAFKHPKLQAIFLNIDSNGCSPTESEMITDYFKLMAKENEMKVYSFILDSAMSGGCWLACAGDEIYVNKTSDVGNVKKCECGMSNVKKCRGSRLNPKRYNKLFNDSSWIGQDAVDIGLVDKVQSIESFIRDNFAGLEQIKLIE